MDRREFLLGSAAGVAGVCLGGVCATGAWAQNLADFPRDMDPMAQAAGEALFIKGDLANNSIARLFGIPPKTDDMMSTAHLSAAYVSADGPRTFGDLTGKIRLLALWAEWCPPCMTELAELNALQIKYGSDRFEIIAVLSGSSTRMDFATARKTVDEAGAANLPVWIEPNGGARTLALAIPAKVMDPTRGVTPSLPCVVIVDEKGVARGRCIGLRNAPKATARLAAPVPPKDGNGKEAVIDSVTTKGPLTAADMKGPSLWSTPDADAFVTGLLAGGLS